MDFKALVESMILQESESYGKGWFSEYEIKIYSTTKPDINFEIEGDFVIPLKGTRFIRMNGNVCRYGVTIFNSEYVD